MMESVNSHRHHHHHHQLQEQPVGSSSSSSSSSSSLDTAPCYGVGATAPNAWNPITFLNTAGFSNPYTCSSDGILNSRQDSTSQLLSNSQYMMTPMASDLGFNWGANNTPAANFIFPNPNQSAQDLQLSRIKEEFSDHYLRKYSEILSSSSSSSSGTDESGLIIRSSTDEHQRNLHKSFSSGNLMDKIQLSPGDQLYPSNGGAARVGLSQIFPSINISNLNQTGLACNPGSLDMNLEALDLLASSRYNGNFGPSPQNHQIGMLRDGFPNFGFDLMQQQQQHQIPLFSPNKVSSVSSNGSAAADTKRSCKMETKPPLENAPKKSRLEARASCPPFKVRKEKLGDRIAALQQLVAPFGKTDTASVLMEAIGYIKFLQNQVETLSVPYMKASRNKSSRQIKGGSVGEMENHQEESTKRDLKSRGLCLVPLSCLSYIADGGSAVVWPPSHLGGAT
ncbi:transcription factor bHLH110 [Andrographis paniculata]|uniref:transcription factor bHLH110 n=1 Tax=Andrographis paniculata TaxID=175694 RepID=UPI0021E879A9|nr:transcription factor bHLH110 [Andrographis paniculata]